MRVLSGASEEPLRDLGPLERDLWTAQVDERTGHGDSELWSPEHLDPDPDHLDPDPLDPDPLDPDPLDPDRLDPDPLDPAAGLRESAGLHRLLGVSIRATRPESAVPSWILFCFITSHGHVVHILIQFKTSLFVSWHLFKKIVPFVRFLKPPEQSLNLTCVVL